MNNIDKTIWMHLDNGTEETVPWPSQTQNPCSEIHVRAEVIVPLPENYRFVFPNLRRVDMSIPPPYVIERVQPTSQITDQRFDLIDRARRLSESIQLEDARRILEATLPTAEMTEIQREEDERVYRILDNIVREGSFESINSLVRAPVNVPPVAEENSVAITNEELQSPIGTHYTDRYD